MSADLWQVSGKVPLVTEPKTKSAEPRLFLLSQETPLGILLYVPDFIIIFKEATEVVLSLNACQKLSVAGRFKSGTTHFPLTGIISLWKYF